MAFDINTIPIFFRSFSTLYNLAITFNEITDESVPDQATRVAMKESLIQQLAAQIDMYQIPHQLVYRVTDNGLRAGFLRTIGENDCPDHYLNAIDIIGNQAGPTDWNLKWQVIRAYVALYLRFPEDMAILESIELTIDNLSAHADAHLLAGIATMKSILKIS